MNTSRKIELKIPRMNISQKKCCDFSFNNQQRINCILMVIIVYSKTAFKFIGVFKPKI